MSDYETDALEREDAIAAEMSPDTDELEAEPEPEEDDEVPPNLPPVEEDAAHLQIQKLDKYADRAKKYLAKNMGEVLGDAATEYLECPFCNYYNTPGFLHASPCPPELLGTVYEWTNTTAPDEYLKDGYSRQCEKCNGLGETATGSKVRGQETLICIDCKGQGWVAVGDERAGNIMYVGNGTQPLVAVPADSAQPAIEASQNLSPEAAAAQAQGYIVIPALSSTG